MGKRREVERDPPRVMRVTWEDGARLEWLVAPEAWGVMAALAGACGGAVEPPACEPPPCVVPDNGGETV